MIVKFVANKGRGRDLKRDLPLLIVVTLLPLRVTSILFLPTISPFNCTLRS